MSFAKGLAWSAFAVLLPTLLRLAFDGGSSSSPFVTYYPAIALAALFLGWRWGAVVAVVSTGVANRLFSAESFWDVLTGPNGLLIPLFALSCAVLVLTGEMVRRLLRELETAHAREELLNQELMHRVKNMLATVNAMAMLTARHSPPEAFTAAFSGRMRALERATDLLGTGHATQCEARQLIEQAIEPFRTDGNFQLEGPVCHLPRDACVPLSLALHELCTNAAKHGALTSPEGKVDLVWAYDVADRLSIRWRESGGPPVPEQRRTGMGTQLLRGQRGLSACELRYPPEGVECDIEIEDAEPVA
jgi:two-component sensor histidine kinase